MADARFGIQVVVDPNLAKSGAAQVEKALKSIQTQALALRSVLLKTLAFAGIGLTIRELFQMAEAFTTVRNQVRALTGSVDEANAIIDQLRVISNETDASFTATVETFRKMQGALSALGVSTEAALDVTELLLKATKAEGKAAEETAIVVQSLAVALSRGQVDGRALTILFRTLPRLAQDLARELKVNVTQLDELAQQGKITGASLVTALFGAEQEIDERLKSVIEDVGGAFNRLRNEILFLVASFDDIGGSTGSFRDAVNSVTDSLVKAGPKIRKFAGDAFAAFKFLPDLFEGTAKALLVAIGSMVGGVDRLLAVLQAMAQTAKFIFNDVIEIIRNAGGAIGAASVGNFQAVQGFADASNEATMRALGAFVRFPDLVASNIRKLNGDTTSFVNEFGENTGKSLGERMAAAFSSAFAPAVEEAVTGAVQGAIAGAAPPTGGLFGAAAGGGRALSAEDAAALGTAGSESRAAAIRETVEALNSEFLASQLVAAGYGELGAQAAPILLSLAKKNVILNSVQLEGLRILLERNQAERDRAGLVQRLTGPEDSLKRLLAASDAVRGSMSLTENQLARLAEEELAAKLATDGLAQSFELNLQQGLINGLRQVTDVGAAIQATLTNAFSGIEDALVNFVRTGKFEFEEFVNSLLDDIARLLVRLLILQAIESTVTGGLGGLINSIAGRAEGGPVRQGVPVVVGEEGPEIFTPSTSGRIIPNNQTMGVLSSPAAAAPPQVNVSVVNVIDPNEVASRIGTGAADRAIMNVLTRNRQAVKAALR